ncbi:MAG: metalloregulator ArsR/SmtB family transcription factor [Boseongicola sp.]|nr:MAG: metalloregulator ArsR/SmtB family transcription factor [Boseongicola sp.]
MQPAFRALADPTRRGIISLLAQEDMTIAEVAGHFDMTRAAVKKHLIVLEDGGVIATHQSGRDRINQLQPLALKSVADWLNHFDHFWNDRLSALKDAVEADDQNKQEK